MISVRCPCIAQSFLQLWPWQGCPKCRGTGVPTGGKPKFDSLCRVAFQDKPITDLFVHEDEFRTLATWGEGQFEEHLDPASPQAKGVLRSNDGAREVRVSVHPKVGPSTAFWVGPDGDCGTEEV